MRKVRMIASFIFMAATLAGCIIYNSRGYDDDDHHHHRYYGEER
jgi:hypothetical protein